jgi:hypothetical protein
LTQIAKPVAPAPRLPQGGRTLAASRNEARIFALGLVRDAQYRANLLKAMRERTVAPAVEVAILAYAYGKPTERVEVGRPGEFNELDEMSPEALLARAQLIAAALAGDPEALKAYAGEHNLIQEVAEQRTDDSAIATRTDEIARRKAEALKLLRSVRTLEPLEQPEQLEQSEDLSGLSEEELLRA